MRFSRLNIKDKSRLSVLLTTSKTIKNNILFLVFISVFSVSFAQNDSSKKIDFIQQINFSNSQDFLKNNISLNLVSDAQDGGIIINQIGMGNNLYIRKNSMSSQQIKQNGNKNYFSFINFYNSQPSNFEIFQQGKGNSIQIYGENSIVKNMKIFQKANNKSIVIKNF